MRTLIWLFIPLALLSACSDDDDANGTGTPGAASSGAGASGSGGTGGGGSSTGGEGAGGGGAGGGAAVGAARVAHLAPDAPAVDFCVSPDAGTTWIGPVMDGVLGDADGLAFTEVTGYLELPVGTYTARLVAPASANCDTALADLPDVADIQVAEATDYTLAATGMLTPAGDDEAFAVRAYGDDNAVPAGQAKLRFIHASPDTPNVDVGTGSGETFAAVFTNVAYGTVGQVGGMDYLTTPPLDGITVSARATGTDTDALVIPGVSLPADAVATAFAIGNLDGDPADLQVLVCVDNGPLTDGLTSCTALP
ncbi:MAG: DUF4397 domain-containing protein [Polyangiaceae bacterium]